MRRFLLTLAFSAAILTVGALVPDRVNFSPSQDTGHAVDFVRLA
jgi:hypothetical protein